MLDNVGKAITLLRELRGLKQTHLAKVAGFTNTQISRYEAGREQPKLDKLVRLFEALNVNPIEFFYVVKLIDDLQAGLEGVAPLPLEEMVARGAGFDKRSDRAFRDVLNGLFTFYTLLFQEQFSLLSPAAMAKLRKQVQTLADHEAKGSGRPADL